MFYFLSKFLVFIMQPLSWLVLVLFMLFRSKNSYKIKRRLKYLIFGLIFFTNPGILNFVLNCWEMPELRVDELKSQYDIGIVLGGFSNPNTSAEIDRLSLRFAATRFSDALLLYKKGKIKKFLFSGGNGNVLAQRNEPTEAAEAKKYLLAIGIPDSDILIETKSRNTRENALFSKKLIDSVMPNAKCLLITSSTHIPRASKCFEKVGLACTVFPTNKIGDKLRLDPEMLIKPDDLAFFKWQIIIKEWIGILVYKWKGFI
jgi:uncharacterized SAM-binding protein YcdF (DUF218 family)